jgi:16S rRNA (guanine527-N7)-methyltransferase
MAGPPKPPEVAFPSLIAQVAERIGTSIDAAAIARLTSWLELMMAWNAKVDLTAARGPEELVDLMVADALVLARLEGQGARVVDVGSGAGGPGLALALLRPDLRVTLVEPLQKRVAFLRTAAGHVLPVPGSAGSLSAGSLKVVRARGEDLLGGVAASGENIFDAAMARATLAPLPWLTLGAQLAPSGVVTVLLAREPPPALPQWAVVHDETYVWPLTGAERRMVRFARRSA